MRFLTAGVLVLTAAATVLREVEFAAVPQKHWEDGWLRPMPVH